MRSPLLILVLTVLQSLCIGEVTALPLPLSFPTDSLLIGSTWALSSSIFTTYFTTSFLKYEAQDSDDFQLRYAEMKEGFDIRKTITKKISRPQLLTLYRFVGSFLLGIFLHPNMPQWINRLKQTTSVMKHFAFPAVFLFTANYCNTISLNRIGISLTYTSKCCIPVITVLLTLMLSGFEALPSKKALFSLICKYLFLSLSRFTLFNIILLELDSHQFVTAIATGVAFTSWKSSSFELIGFLAAMGSATAQSVLNVSSKRSLNISGISGLEAQRSMAALASIISIFVTGVNCFGNRKELHDKKKSSIHPPNWLSFAAIASYHLEYTLSFMFTKLVTPITFGACDALRRLLIIISGRRMFGGEKFTILNRVGIGLALCGAFCYSFYSV